MPRIDGTGAPRLTSEEMLAREDFTAREAQVARKACARIPAIRRREARECPADMVDRLLPGAGLDRRLSVLSLALAYAYEAGHMDEEWVTGGERVYTSENVLAELRTLALKVGGTPQITEIDRCPALPHSSTIKAWNGGIALQMRKAGLVPNTSGLEREPLPEGFADRWRHLLDEAKEAA